MAKFQITYKVSPRDQLSQVEPSPPETITATMAKDEGDFMRFYDDEGLVLSVENDRILEVRRTEP
jgi:hypothetical protein